VDGVTVVKFVPGERGPRTVAVIATSIEELRAAQGSKYCPTSVNLLLRDCLRHKRRYLFVGTPCQVGSLRLLLRERPEYAPYFPLTIANFCGGYRDFRYLDGMIRESGLEPARVSSFRMRGGGWPGSMLASTANGETATQPYPDYRSDALVNKQRRCTLCVDGTGLLADFACGDAWLDRFRETGRGWSMIVLRSPEAEGTFAAMREAGLVTAVDVSLAELRQSQRFNLDSKIHRQQRRMALFQLLQQKVPSYDLELPSSRTSYAAELKVLILKTKPFLYANVTFRRTALGGFVARALRRLRRRSRHARPAG